MMNYDVYIYIHICIFFLWKCHIYTYLRNTNNVCLYRYFSLSPTPLAYQNARFIQKITRFLLNTPSLKLFRRCLSIKTGVAWLTGFTGFRAPNSKHSLSYIYLFSNVHSLVNEWTCIHYYTFRSSWKVQKCKCISK